MVCRFCGADLSGGELLHDLTCDGQQGKVEAAINATMPPVHVGPHFNGPEYQPERDHARLTGQIKRVYDLMVDGTWRTFQEIEAMTRDPAPSISAQLRHLRKRRFGSFIVERRQRGESTGLYEYRLLPPATEDNRRDILGGGS